MRDADYIHNIMERSHAAQFSYDRNSHAFTVGERKVSLEEAVENHRTLYPQEGDALADHETTMLASTVIRTVMYPRMYDWLNENLTRELQQETVEVMIDTYAELRSDIPRKNLQPDSGLFGFSAERIRSEHPHLTFSVLGHCACMGVSVDGMIGQYEWDTKFAAFDMHNIDTPEQHISVLSGLTHLAFKAMNG